MKSVPGLALSLLCLLGDLHLHGAPAAERTRAIDALPVDALDEAIELLREHYLTPAALDEQELKRATLQGLLERLGTGATLVDSGAGATAAASPFRSEVLDGRIAYVRLGSIRDEHLVQLDTALADVTTRSLTALVLDLRATPPGTDYERAAEVCRRFTPKGRVLFTVRKPRAQEERVLTSRDEPKFTGLLVVLVDPDSAGSAEVIAAVLRAETRAMVIGQQTKGEAVEFADLPLPGGKVLRTAVAEVVLPQGAPVFPGGLTPDLRVEVPQETTDAVLARQVEKGVAESVFETERRRMNEAALVAGVNPEIEALEAARAAKEKAPERDAVLQRAVDFITSLRFLDTP
jgi:Peptidase family S41